MTKARIKNIQLSLSELVGEAYIESVCRAKAVLDGDGIEKFHKIAHTRVAFFPVDFAVRVDKLIDLVGQKVCASQIEPFPGAGTNAFVQATRIDRAPLSGLGFIRIGEDGRVYLTSKSEHYHLPLGHSFPGYKLIEYARQLGIPNATHNNTRGYITRRLETELIRVANGIKRDDRDELNRVLNSSAPHVVNRVLNLETGSLAVEAALKMMLARFFRLDATYPAPKYAGKTPIFLVLADHGGGKEANYHGTTIVAQLLRGMWPDLYAALEKNDIFRVVQVKINDINDFAEKVKKFDTGKYKIAGFLHEIVLMNYGGIKLTRDYLQQAYEICRAQDIPVIVDEIQSCLWSPEFFMFKEYGLQPDFISVGKGFPGGEYPASRLLTTTPMDNLNLFGALVTNGQEELASLAYLITMAFAEANQQYTAALGDYYENQVRELHRKFSNIVTRVEGSRHLTSLFFKSPEQTVEFVRFLNERGIDISAQTYKANFPPSALTKLPIIASYKMVDFIIENMKEALKNIGK